MHPEFETAVKQEEAYLRLVHPTPDDIPKCMTLFDTFLTCHGELSVIKSLNVCAHLCNSNSITGEVPLPVRQDDRVLAQAG